VGPACQGEPELRRLPAAVPEAIAALVLATEALLAHEATLQRGNATDRCVTQEVWLLVLCSM
jgi:hypothetical protein